MNIIPVIPIIATIALVFGLLLMFNPTFVKRLNELGNRIITTDEAALAHRYITGAILIILSLTLIIVSWP
ncbi:MAG: hypothetical protein ACE5D1_06090 [Fidelibacterota bacterium]